MEEIENNVGNSPEFVMDYLWASQPQLNNPILIDLCKMCTQFEIN